MATPVFSRYSLVKVKYEANVLRAGIYIRSVWGKPWHHGESLVLPGKVTSREGSGKYILNRWG